jgi:TatD DNase family protein
MIDSHCHLADDAFADDGHLVVARAREAGVERALCVLDAGNGPEAARAAALVRSWPGLSLAIGVHPHHARLYEGREVEAARLVRAEVAATPSARAIGEIGLDYHYDFSPPGVQRRVLGAQLALARELGLPVVIHAREADADILALLEAGPQPVRGVLHCFAGSPLLAGRAVDLGLHISFAGIVTFPRAGELRDVARTVPADRLLVETDSPYLAPVPYRGRRNEPAFVSRVLETLAELRGVPPDALAAQVTRNFEGLFGPSRADSRVPVR